MDAGLPNRRLFIASATGALLLRPRPAAACVLAPEREEGPYYVPREHVRRSLAEGQPGIALSLRVRLLDVRSCAPLRNMALDVWHCNAAGVYSGYTAQGGGPPGPPGPPGPSGPGAGFAPPKAQPTDTRTYLRGIQISNVRGDVSFETIFPGFYAGRVNHVHVKVYPAAAIGTNGTNRVVHTGQIFFPEALAAELSRRQPYARHHIERTTLEEDRVFASGRPAASIAALEPVATGYRASIVLAVNPAAIPAPLV